MIPKELIQQWEKEAQMLCDERFDKGELVSKIEYNFYIKGRTDQYLQMQAENERLKGLIYEAYCSGVKYGVSHTDGFLTWQQFKTQHNL